LNSKPLLIAALQCCFEGKCRFFITLTETGILPRVLIVLTTRITGNMLRAGRALARLSQAEICKRAGLHRQTIYTWENSSDSVPAAYLSKLTRVISVLESEGVVFVAGGARLLSKAKAPTIAHSEACGANCTEFSYET
jgi:DNA-binding XRE family transcriptional regulator